jgi:hypothetical protein
VEAEASTQAASAVEAFMVEAEASTVAEAFPAGATWASTAAGGRSPVFMVEASRVVAADGAVAEAVGVVEDGAAEDLAGEAEAGVGADAVGVGAMVGVGRGGAGDGVGAILMATTDIARTTPILMTTTRGTMAATTIRILTTGAAIRRRLIRMPGHDKHLHRISMGHGDLGGPRRSSSQRRRNLSRRRRRGAERSI